MGYELYKGYVEVKDKKCIEKFKGRNDFKTLKEVQSLNEYAGILAKNTLFIDIDDREQAEIMMKIVEDMKICCKVINTSRGKHFIFRNIEIKSCKTHTPLAIGLTADIKCGFKDSYEVLKVNGKERDVVWDIEPEAGEEYQEVPKWMFPIKHKMTFLEMEAGQGRNQELFNYILTLQSNDYSVEECRECIRIINKYVLKDPLDEQEIETILRDDAFQKPIFFNNGTFLFDKFANYIKNVEHIIIINGNLHIYEDGAYRNNPKLIERAMIRHIPNLSDAKRREVFKYLLLACEEKELADARYIPFRNGILDVVTKQLQEATPDMIVTNRIPHDYNPEAYDELMDKTLDKISCDDDTVRALLEECVGYCLYRRNERKKAFILTGSGNNGKSTFLDCVKALLGEDNISALDLKEIGDRFSTSMMFGKLANIGDDIGDDFLMGSQVAMFKKVVAGNRIKAERKGQDPFEFNPYTKLLFSANEIPRMKDKTGAVLNRLIIIPFSATFSKKDKDFDPEIKYKLCVESAIEYLIKIGIEGLERVLDDEHGFTGSKRVEKQLAEYERENNPISGFLEENDVDDIINNSTNDVYAMYQIFCNEGNHTPLSKVVFSRQINERLGTEVVVKCIKGKSVRVFVQRRF